MLGKNIELSTLELALLKEMVQFKLGQTKQRVKTLEKKSYLIDEDKAELESKRYGVELLKRIDKKLKAAEKS